MRVYATPTQTILPPKTWWLALGLIVACACLLRYTGYNFSLPYIDHVDEPAYNLAGRMILDYGSAKPLGMQGYPPGIVELNYVVIKLFQQPSTPPGSVLWIIRLISITFSILTIIAIGLLGYRVSTPLGGLLAAGLWTFSPLLVEFSRYGTADNFVTFFTVLALFLSVTGTRYNRSSWLYASIVSIMLAIVFKYQAIFVLPLVLFLPATRFYYTNLDRKAIRTTLIWMAVILAVFFVWLLLLYPSLEATTSPDWSAPTSRLALPSPWIIWKNFGVILAPLASSVPWIVGCAGLAGLFWKPLRTQVYLLGITAAALAAMGWITGLSFYGDLGSKSVRQLISAGAFLTVCRSTGLAAWAFLFSQLIEQFSVLRIKLSRALWAGSGVVVVMLALALIPDIKASVANAYEHTLPDRRNDLAQWADKTLTPGSYFSGMENYKTFNTAWGGYTGTTSLNWLTNAPLEKYTIEEWRQKGANYAIISTSEYQSLLETPEGQATLDKMLLLKAYPPSRAYRGPDMAILRLYPIHNRVTNIPALGPIHLVGYDIDQTEIPPTGSVTFTLYWRSDAPTGVPYAVFNHLVGDDGQMIGQIDNDPMFNVRRPTTTWDDPDETLISGNFTLTINKLNINPGKYHLVSGFYRRDTGERLLSVDRKDSVLVQDITVDPVVSSASF